MFFPPPFLIDSIRGKKFQKIVFLENVSVCPCVRSGTHSSIIGRFCVTENDGFEEKISFCMRF